MSQLLFLVGLGLTFVGKINVGDINVEGRVVRGAGAILMMPLAFVLVLSKVLDWLNGSIVGGESGGVIFLLIVELSAMVACSGYAYLMLKRASEEDQPDSSDNPNVSSTIKIQPKDRKPSTPPVQQPPKNNNPRQPENSTGYSDLMRSRMQNNPSSKRDDFPAVMDIREAARYLDKTEKEVMKLIDQGKLAAARINYRFRISRTVLDDFIEEQNNSSDAPTV